jgi:hypothetical protein
MSDALRIRALGHTDQGGRPDGVQVMVARGHAYVGHMFSDGITVIDVVDPRAPKPVQFIGCPPNTRASHIQVHDGLLLAVNAANVWALQQYEKEQDYFGKSLADSFDRRDRGFAAGMRVFDLADPASPREIGFMPIEGIGLHRIWWVGGRYTLCIGASRRVHRPHPGGDRHGGPDPAGNRRAVVVTGHAPCRWRNAKLGRRPPRGAAPHDHGGQSRLCRVARRWAHGDGPQRSGRAQAVGASQLVAAVCRRYAHAAAAARSRTGCGGRRGDQQPLRQRPGVYLGAGRSRAGQSGDDRDAADAKGRGVLQRHERSSL